VDKSYRHAVKVLEIVAAAPPPPDVSTRVDIERQRGDVTLSMSWTKGNALRVAKSRRASNAMGSERDAQDHVLTVLDRAKEIRAKMKGKAGA